MGWGGAFFGIVASAIFLEDVLTGGMAVKW
ncbi:MAG: hypothetical protein RI897_3758 [Verrucomicrobiota bacterium]|jgi:hypothetical protein